MRFFFRVTLAITQSQLTVLSSFARYISDGGQLASLQTDCRLCSCVGDICGISYGLVFNAAYRDMGLRSLRIYERTYRAR